MPTPTGNLQSLALWLLLLPSLLAGCGYHNPNVLPSGQASEPVTIHAPVWSNATSEPGLEMRAHNAVNDWLAQSGRFIMVSSPEEARYLLEGEITSLRYPGFSYDRIDSVRSLGAILTASVSLKERATGQVLWSRGGLRLDETYDLGGGNAQTDANKRQALDQLVDNLGREVYLRVIRTIKNL